MKKINIFLLVFLPVIVIVWIVIVMNTSKGGQAYLNAVVLEVKETFVVTEVLDVEDNDDTLLAGSKVQVIINTDTVNKSARPDFSEGDIIRVVYHSDSVQHEPLRIETVYAIYLYDELD